jgi:hypothetical protein
VTYIDQSGAEDALGSALGANCQAHWRATSGGTFELRFTHNGTNYFEARITGYVRKRPFGVVADALEGGNQAP